MEKIALVVPSMEHRYSAEKFKQEFLRIIMHIRLGVIGWRRAPFSL